MLSAPPQRSLSAGPEFTALLGLGIVILLASTGGVVVLCSFVPGDFLDRGSRETVDLALHRLALKGTIRRLARGVYDFPKGHPALGLLSPSADAVAHALAGRDHTWLQPAGSCRS
jgi:hypothetical protein